MGNTLLSEVYMDALQKAEGVVSISLVDCLVDFVETVWKKKVVGLLREIHKYPRDVVLFDSTIKGLEYVVAGMCDEEILEAMVEDYWLIKDEGNRAFERYVGILGVFMMKEEYSSAKAQQIVLQQFGLRNQAVFGNEV